ncbi:MAG: hypothetical protein A3F11_00430 [Gammaproteobacteria bacterium RIFCSPHIGHO2_12_FULL_37_14]|nr:MAG: hypothetical protein A3F11_00430 [Gammaproteobacteria bacterium RIFCSPHIGHO2_12_FULL_37_14]
MFSRLKDLAESLLPNVIQFPFKRLKKAYDNLITYQRKIFVTSVRLACEISLALFAMSILWMSPGFKHALFGFALSELEDPLSAAIVGYSILLLAGFGFGSVSSKHALRLYHILKFGTSNSDYIGLAKREKKLLEQRWFMVPEISNAIFKFLVEKIFQAKKKALHDNKITSTHQQTIVSTKLALQTFRRTAKDSELDLIPLVEYFEQELTRSKIYIRATRLQINHLSKTLSDARIVAQNPSVPTSNDSNVIELPSVAWKEEEVESLPEYVADIEATGTDQQIHLPHLEKKKMTRTVSFWYKKPTNFNNVMVKRLESNIKEHEENIQKIRYLMTQLHG